MADSLIHGAMQPDILELSSYYRYLGETLCFNPNCPNVVKGGVCLNNRQHLCQSEDVIRKVGSGINIRRAFRAREGYKLVSIDFRGIELRVAAQMSGEILWLNAFQLGQDLHGETAARIFKTPNYTKAQRDQAKTANFGLLYLGGPPTLANQSGLSEAESRFIYMEWWKSVPFYKKWTEEQNEIAKSEHQVKTFFGRIRHMEDIINKAESKIKEPGKKKSGKGFVGRTACNSPVQGTAADLMKLAMVKVHSWVMKEKMKEYVRLLLTVHDELVFEIKHESDSQFISLCTKVSDIMCLPELKGMLSLDGRNKRWEVPIETDIEYGENWADMQDLKELVKKQKDSSLEEFSISKQEVLTAIPEQVSNDKITLVLNLSLTKDIVQRIMYALQQASNTQNVVKVPLKIKLIGKEHQTGFADKVYSPVLKSLLGGINGISFEEN